MSYYEYERCIYSTKLVHKLSRLDRAYQIDLELVDKAIFWAKKYHAGQMRKSGEPFYSHPLAVAYMLADYNLKTDVIVASILHDIVEDTEVTAGMLLDAFGRRIEEMVDRLTRDRPDGRKWTVEELLNNAYKKKDKEALLIKLFDRMHNLQTIESMKPHKQKEIAKETLQDVLVLATIYHDLNLEKLLSNKIFTILYGKDIATLMINKRYNPLSAFDSYRPPLPTFQNEK